MPRKSALAPVAAPLGRPTKYKPEYAQQAFKLALLGLSDERMADVFSISVDTLYEWKKVYPAFSEAILKGGDPADAIVADSLYKLANGFEKVTETVLVVDGAIVHEPVVKYFPPSVAAANKWLANRQRKKWNDKIEITGPDGGPIQSVNLNITADPVEAAKIYQKLMSGEV
jgi:hypothetical protein